MSLSNYEVQVILGCLECEYSDKKKLEEMKQFHDREDWINCSKVKGSCLFPFKRRMVKDQDGHWICLECGDQE